MDKLFAEDLLRGLQNNPKRLSSKYFYDTEGSRIFQEIMSLPEYYLSRAEKEILTEQPKQIIDALNYNGPFEVVELGAGDGSKTFKLLEYLLRNNYQFTYRPVDISQGAMDVLVDHLSQDLPNLQIKPMVGDYFEVIKQVPRNGKPMLMLFLGSNIGNYEKEGAISLLNSFGNGMSVGDHLLIGMDLKKNPNKIAAAYNDASGVTAKFNLNLLNRINQEFDANFDLSKFQFYSHYNPANGEVRSFLVSTAQQEVRINALNEKVTFKKDELIATELSKKYSLQDIEEIAALSGFGVVEFFMDKNDYFSDCLWRRVEQSQ